MIFSECEELTELQEDEWDSDNYHYEDGKAEDECLTHPLENNATDSALVPSGAVKLECKDQGVPRSDILQFESEVSDMLESVRKLQTTLSEGSGGVDEVLRGWMAGEEGTGETPSAEGSLEAAIQQIERTEATLRVKMSEERKAKLCRMQAEEESRDILKALPCREVSTGVRMNLEEFIRLLNEVEETESDFSRLRLFGSGGLCEERKKGMVDGGGEEVDDEDDENCVGCIAGGVCCKKGNGKDAPGVEETRERKEKEAEEKRVDVQRKAKKLKFVEKNIELAKCGGGTLSLTEEEKVRIEKILVEDSGDVELSKDVYVVDDETKSKLAKIDEQLEAVGKGERVELLGSSVVLMEESGGRRSEKDEKGRAGEKKERNRLAEINKLLNEMNSVCLEEVTPLSEEEIVCLVEESKGRVSLEKRSEEEGACEDSKGSEDVISELVSSAKILMPKFKYRFDHS